MDGNCQAIPRKPPAKQDHNLGGDISMTTVIPRGQEENGGVNNQGAGRRARLTTTLYDLITVLQKEGPSGDD